ncbi:MFS transporter [Actinocorallia longicatena]
MNLNAATRKWSTLAICCLAYTVLSIDLTALHLAIPQLVADLNPSATQILWIADGYGFALAALLITMGWLGDRIGRKKLLLTGVGLFAAASAITAYAHTPELLIGARVLLGVAGATIMPSCLSLVRNVFTDPKERTMAVGISSGVAGLGVGLGPVFGGALLDHFWWGSVFLINVPIMAVIFVLGSVALPESRDPRPGRLDVPSVLLSGAGIVGFVYTVKELAAEGWAPEYAVTGLAAVALLALFLRRQTRIASPLIDVRLFRLPAFSGSVGVNMFAMFALVAQSLVFAQYFQMVLGWSPWIAGVAGLPGALGAMAGGAALAPALITAIGRNRAIGVGMVLSAGSFVSYSFMGLDAHYWALMFPTMIFGGMGIGVAMTVTSDTILASVPKDRAGAAAAISETATELGGALGMALLGSVLNAAYRGGVEVPAGVTGPARDAVEDSLAGAFEAAGTLPSQLAGQAIAAARSAYVDGMHVTLYCSAVLALAAGVAAVFALRSVPKVIEAEDDERELVAA